MTIEPQSELNQLRLGLLQIEGQIKECEAKEEAESYKKAALQTQHSRQEGIILYIIGKQQQLDAQAKAQTQPSPEPPASPAGRA